MERVVARRYDQLCGRLMSIYFALAISEKLDLDFEFTWPEGKMANPKLGPDRVFSQAFLDDFLISEKKFWKERSNNSVYIGKYHPDADSANLVVNANHVGLIPKCLLDNPFPNLDTLLDIDSFSAELADFLRELRELDCHGIHIRHGDVVHGNWRHFGHMNRFVPYDTMNWFIRKSGCDADIIVFADDLDADENLRKSFFANGIRYLPATSHPVIHRDLSDLFQMAFCQSIFCPKRSAYSAFASIYRGARRDVVAISSVADWAVEAQPLPNNQFPNSYVCKRNLYIVEALQASGLVQRHSTAVERLLDHCEEVHPDNAQIYALRIELDQVIKNRDTVETLLEKHRLIIESESDGVMMAEGLSQLRQTLSRGIGLKPSDRELLKDAIQLLAS